SVTIRILRCWPTAWRARQRGSGAAGHRNLFTARVAGHESNTGVILLHWEAANGTTLRLPPQLELAAGQLVQWMIASTAVRLPSFKAELHQSDNPVTGRVETRLNLGAHC